MDTGDGGAEQSPWRIKVTVQAEPRDGSSPSKKPATRTTTVPLKGGSSSPAKRPARKKKKAVEAEESEMDVEIKRPQRKRKGTPIRRAPRRPTPAKVAEEEAKMAEAEEQDQDVAVASSPTKKPAKRKGRRSLDTMQTQRGQRLSQARDELDTALQDAVGDDEYEEDMPRSDAMQGDMTVMNEDFTMISVETLESMKQNTSMLEDSQIGDKSAVNGSYWPSSPPEKPQSALRASKGLQSGSKVDYPNISAQAQFARETPAKSFVQAFDAMSWKPTGRAAQEPTPAESSELQHSSEKKQTTQTEPEQWRKERQNVSEQIENASKEEVIKVDDEPDAELGAEASGDDRESRLEDGDGGDDDIWAEEASRSLEEDVESSHLSRRFNRRSPHHPKSGTAEHLNDLFSGGPSKPPRAKIPRTWRRSSGMDFQYSDSPAHSFAREEEPEGRKASGTSGSEAADDDGERGSGVLTPPSTEEDEDEGDEDDQMDDTEDDNEVGASKSLFEPDAAATELQVHRGSDAGSASESESEEGDNTKGEDTGLFWQRNLPSMYKRPTRPRFSEQRKAKDLSALLRENESSQIEKKESPKAAPPQAAQPTQAPPRRFPGSSRLAARREAASSSFTSTSSGDRSQVQVKQKVVESPLRKSLLKSSKIGGAKTDGNAAVVAAQENAREMPEVRPGDVQRVFREYAEQSEEGNTSLSFASKTSDQRQLLGETHATPGAHNSRMKPRHSETQSPMDFSLWQSAGRGAGDDRGQAAAADSPAPAMDYSASSPAEDAEENDSEDEEVQDTPDEDEPGDVGETESVGVETSQQLADTTRSYEEHLNLSSPQKIKVNFGSSAKNSSLLQPKKAYPPLFDSRPPSRGHQLQAHSKHQPERTLIAKSTASEPGLLTKLTSTFWSAIVRPSGPTSEPVFPAALRTRLRSRYGVLSAQHPWTMAHMWTLHRMMNSVNTQTDSLVPAPGELDLPSGLVSKVGRKMKDPFARSFVLTPELAMTAYAFTQLLVPQSFIAQIESGEIDFIGDHLALEVRGYWDEYEGQPRHGSDRAFDEAWLVGGKKPRDGAKIGAEWVAACLSVCVVSQRNYEEEGRKREAETRAWERRNGFDVEEEEDGESEVLQKVRRV